LEIIAIISRLKEAKTGSRQLDAEVAKIAGWTRRVESFTDQATGEVRNRALWLVPKTEDPGTVPYYTTALEAAYQLARHIAPSEVGGCSWEDDKASARIGENGPYTEAATPALALCVAALELRRGADP